MMANLAVEHTDAAEQAAYADVTAQDRVMERYFETTRWPIRV